MYSVIVSFGVFVSLSFPISIDKGILGAYATETCMRTVLDPVFFIAIFVVDKLSFSSSSCPDKNARKFPVRFRLRRS